MNKVVISGFYGFHNIGDEAILRTLTLQLRALDPTVQITVLSKSPEETMEKFGVKAVDRSSPMRVFWEIFKTDILISGGGSLLQDITSGRSIFYYLSIIRAGILFRKRVVLLSHGIGPLVRAENKRRVRRALNKVSVITVRDFQSEQLLKEIGVNMSKVHVTADPVMGMPMAPPEIGRQILDDLGSWETSRKRIAIAVRQKDFRDETRKAKLVELTKRLAQHYEVYYLPFYYKNDTKIYDDIHELVGPHVHFVIEKYQSQDFMSLVQNMDVLIGSRLHSLIFALVAEVPFIGVSYDPKIDHFLETVDLTAVCNIEQFDPDAVFEATQALFVQYESAYQHGLAQKALLKQKLNVNEAVLKNILKPEGR